MVVRCPFPPTSGHFTGTARIYRILCGRLCRTVAAEAIVALLEADGTATQRGMEAKIADVKYPGQRYPINPHHLTTARQRLLAAGVIEETRERTRGGGVVPVFTLSSPTKAAQCAAGCKRLLAHRVDKQGRQCDQIAHVLELGHPRYHPSRTSQCR